MSYVIMWHRNIVKLQLHRQTSNGLNVNIKTETEVTKYEVIFK